MLVIYTVMQIKKATNADIEIILQIVDQARDIMRENGNLTQWNDGYPSRDIILGDISRDQAFVCVEDGEVVGYFCFMKGDKPEQNYEVIENGAWLNEKPYGVIHRLASGRKVRGIAHKAFEFAFENCNNIKVDTHRDNIPMKNFLNKNGFVYCGVIYVGDGSARDAYQKQVFF